MEFRILQQSPSSYAGNFFCLVRPRLGIRQFLSWASLNTTFLRKRCPRIEPRRKTQYRSDLKREGAPPPRNSLFFFFYKKNRRKKRNEKKRRREEERWKKKSNSGGRPPELKKKKIRMEEDGEGRR